MSPDQARQQIAFIRSQIEGCASGGILDTNTLHGLLFHAERGLEAAAEIERLMAAPRIPAQWDGLITLEHETYINGIRYAPGVYGTKLYNIAGRSDEPQF